MNITLKLVISLENEIVDSFLYHFLGHGTFSLLENNTVLLAYDEVNEQPIPKKGKVVKIENGVITEIFCTGYPLWSSVTLMNDDMFLVNASSYHADTEKSDRGILTKVNNSGDLVWQYELDGPATALPVVWQDSILITDFMDPKPRSPSRIGHIYIFKDNGKLILKKRINGINNIEPFVLPEEKEFLLGSSRDDFLLLIDFTGKTKKETKIKSLCAHLVSSNDKLQLLGVFNQAIVALDHDLNTLWKYRPKKGFPYTAPAIDLEGNLYTLCTYRKLVSIDCRGKERWVVDLPGEGNQPIILNDSNILVITSDPSGKRSNQEQYITYVNIFNKDGNKVTSTVLPGYIFHAQQSKDNNIYVATNTLRINRKEESEIRSIKLFKLTLN